jgi:tripartite-type tricarboxylate transporter receptor subunit TctC
MTRSILSSLPHAQAGELGRSVGGNADDPPLRAGIGSGRAGNRRMRAWPDIPTVAETGYAEAVADPWNGIFAPAGTPPEVADRLHREFLRIVEQPEVRERFAQLAMEPRLTPPDRFAAEIREAVLRWPPVVKAAGIRTE